MSDVMKSQPVVKILIPSMGRPDSVTTTSFVPEAAICVPDSEVADYVQYNDCEIVGHPDSVKGLMNKRQWMYDKFGDIFMLDDDLIGMKRNYLSAADEHDPELGNWVDANTAYALIQQLASMAQQMGVYFFGYTHIKNPMYFQPQKPFKLQGNINGGWTGLLKGSKLHYPDVEFWIEDDYLSLLNRYYHRYTLIDNRYSFVEKQQKKGGIVGQRDPAKVEGGLNFLRQKFGSSIVDGMYGGRNKNGR